MAGFSPLIMMVILRVVIGSLSTSWSEDVLLEEVPLPCSCESIHELLDLGHNYYPRYVPSRKCSLGSCWRGPYHCVDRIYKVKVLKKRNEEDDALRIYDSQLPESLREMWKFEVIPVTVACECLP